MRKNLKITDLAIRCTMTLIMRKNFKLTDLAIRCTIILLLCLSNPAFSQQVKGDYPYHGVNFTQVNLQDNFWLPRMEINRKASIPHNFSKCFESGRFKNFTMAAAHEGKFCTIYPFDDTDIYKTLEGAAYSLQIYPDPQLDKYCDSLIAIVGKAQEPDGYLYTARSIDSTKAAGKCSQPQAP